MDTEVEMVLCSHCFDIADVVEEKRLMTGRTMMVTRKCWHCYEEYE